MNTSKIIFVFLIAVAMPACLLSKKTIEVGYFFQETTTITHNILLNNEITPIKFSEKSKQESVASLLSLKPSILYANGDGDCIVLSGNFIEAEKLFILKEWHIKAPFYELVVENEEEVPHVTKKVLRTFLKRSDFIKTEAFNPYNLNFNPKTYVDNSRVKN